MLNMKQRLVFAGIWMAIAIAVMVYQQHQISVLRHVVQDKNIYIDAGCHGRYQGDEE